MSYEEKKKIEYIFQTRKTKSTFAIVTDEELENINGSGSIWGAIAGGAVKGATAGRLAGPVKRR